jgi:hypothetical protein
VNVFLRHCDEKMSVFRGRYRWVVPLEIAGRVSGLNRRGVQMGDLLGRPVVEVHSSPEAVRISDYHKHVFFMLKKPHEHDTGSTYGSSACLSASVRMQ